MKIILVILVGVAVGVAIELALAHRQRSRRVVLDEPDLPPGVAFTRESRPRRRSGRSAASDPSVVFDDDGGFRVLGPVEYDDARSAPWDDGHGESDGDH